jgi:hypothetical protein
MFFLPPRFVGGLRGAFVGALRGDSCKDKKW